MSTNDGVKFSQWWYLILTDSCRYSFWSGWSAGNRWYIWNYFSSILNTDFIFFSRTECFAVRFHAICTWPHKYAGVHDYWPADIKESFLISNLKYEEEWFKFWNNIVKRINSRWLIGLAFYQLPMNIIQIEYLHLFHFPPKYKLHKYLILYWRLIPEFLKSTGKILTETFLGTFVSKKFRSSEFQYLLLTPFHLSKNSFRTKRIFQHFLHRCKKQCVSLNTHAKPGLTR